MPFLFAFLFAVLDLAMWQAIGMWWALLAIALELFILFVIGFFFSAY